MSLFLRDYDSFTLDVEALISFSQVDVHGAVHTVLNKRRPCKRSKQFDCEALVEDHFAPMYQLTCV